MVFYDRVKDDREAIAAKICAERGATLVKPFDQPEVIAGQGTVGLEIAEDAARFGVALDTVRQMESHLLMRNYEGFLRKKAKGA